MTDPSPTPSPHEPLRPTAAASPGRGPAPAPEAPPRRRPLAHVCLESRYRKLTRELPQTIFWCPECKGNRRRRRDCARCQGFGKLTKDSVQELIGRRLLPAFRARDGRFHGAGREDMDVLMLGRGRPFVYEVVGPRHLDVDLEALRQQITESSGGRIELLPFVRVPRARIVELKEGKFAKVYRARVAVDADVPADVVAALKGRRLTIVQRTPKRVAHRRADLEREREVEILAAEPVAARELRLEVQCAHGTYVKEWISGEEGRTQPALPAIANAPCRCETLDVLEILTGE